MKKFLLLFLLSCSALAQQGIFPGTGTGGGLPAGFTANVGTGILTVPNGYAISSGQQVVNNYTQGTAATTPPANTVQFGAPLSVIASYGAYLPSAAPTDASGDVMVVPQGGGTGTWQMPSQGPGRLIQTQTVGSATASVTFTSIPQQYHHLKLIIGGLVTTGNTSIQLNFNGDVTSADYNVNYLVMAYSPTITGAGSFGSPGAVVGTINPGWGGSEVTIYNYSSAAGAKFYTAYGSSWQFFVGGGEWNSNNPLTSIVATISSGTTWGPGSVLSLYGVN